MQILRCTHDTALRQLRDHDQDHEQHPNHDVRHALVLQLAAHWLCNRGRELFRRDCGSHLLTEYCDDGLF